MPAGKHIPLGVSACLLGEEVRYDGGHKRHSLVADGLGRYFQLTSLCPEVAIGLGVPRAPIRLEGEPSGPRARGVEDPGLDVTAKLEGNARTVLDQHPDIAGYVFKCRSPSCGVQDTPVFAGDEQTGTTAGVYAGAVMSGRPLLPVIDEVRLSEPSLFECFLRKVSSYHRWLALQAEGFTADGMRRFHDSHRLLVLAHAPDAWAGLEKIMAGTPDDSLEAIGPDYMANLLAALSGLASPLSHTNVLLDVFDTLKRHLGAVERNELAIAIADFSRSAVSWHVPVLLLRPGIKAHPALGFAKQYYFYPHPALDLWQPVAAATREATS